MLNMKRAAPLALLIGVGIGIAAGAWTSRTLTDPTPASGSSSTESAVSTEAESLALSDPSLPDEAALEKEVRASSVDFIDIAEEAYIHLMNALYPRHSYDTSAFSMGEDGLLRYEDDAYVSRCGIDVSEFNGEIDWEAVRDAGYTFVFIRLGYRGYDQGALNEDARFAENLSGAMDAGLDVGVYFFAQAVSEEEAVEEAHYVLERLDGIELQLPIIYDPEPIKTDEARTDDVTGAQFTKNTAAFCRTIRQGGYEAGYYANLRWEVFMLDMIELEPYTVWYAGYESSPRTPYAFSFWQYSDTGTVPGIAEATDLDIQLLPKN